MKLMNNNKAKLIALAATSMNDPTIYLRANDHMVNLSLLLRKQSRDGHKLQNSDLSPESKH